MSAGTIFTGAPLLVLSALTSNVLLMAVGVWLFAWGLAWDLAYDRGVEDGSDTSPLCVTEVTGPTEGGDR